MNLLIEVVPRKLFSAGKTQDVTGFLAEPERCPVDWSGPHPDVRRRRRQLQLLKRLSQSSITFFQFFGEHRSTLHIVIQLVEHRADDKKDRKRRHYRDSSQPPQNTECE